MYIESTIKIGFKIIHKFSYKCDHSIIFALNIYLKTIAKIYDIPLISNHFLLYLILNFILILIHIQLFLSNQN